MVLHQARLLDQIGRVPVLIISERGFAPSLGDLIFHLDFPFEADALRRQVQDLLKHGGQACARGLADNGHTGASSAERRWPDGEDVDMNCRDDV